MKIDITPQVEVATGTDRICIDMREIEALYVVRLANGNDYTTKFEKKELDEFQPKRTVSEMIKIWEENILRRHAEATNALKTGLHPDRTVERKIMAVTSAGFEYPTGEVVVEPKQLDSYERKHFKKLKSDMEEKFGKMTFVKIC